MISVTIISMPERHGPRQRGAQLLVRVDDERLHAGEVTHELVGVDGLQRARIGHPLERDRDVVARVDLEGQRRLDAELGGQRDRSRACRASRAARRRRPRTGIRPRSSSISRLRAISSRPSSSQGSTTEPTGALRSHSSQRSCMPGSRPSAHERGAAPRLAHRVGLAAERVDRYAGRAQAAGHRQGGAVRRPGSRPAGWSPTSRRLRLGRGRPTCRGATFVISVPSPPVPASSSVRTQPAASASPAGGPPRRSPRASRRPSRC